MSGTWNWIVPLFVHYNTLYSFNNNAMKFHVITIALRNLAVNNWIKILKRKYLYNNSLLLYVISGWDDETSQTVCDVSFTFVAGHVSDIFHPSIQEVLNQDIFISPHCTRGDHNIFLMNSAHKRSFMILFLPISIPAFYDYEELNWPKLIWGLILSLFMNIL